MPYGDMRVTQNKARVGEPARGIIQFEILSGNTERYESVLWVSYELIMEL